MRRWTLSSRTGWYAVVVAVVPGTYWWQVRDPGDRPAVDGWCGQRQWAQQQARNELRLLSGRPGEVGMQWAKDRV